MTLEQRIPLVRDLITLAVGAGGFVYSVLTGAGWAPLVLSAALMAGPGVVQLWLLGRTPGGASLSPLVSPDPPQPPSLPSSVPSAGE